MPKIIILSGIPGSGKSTWCNWYKTHNYNCLSLSRDEIRENSYYFPKPYTYTKENENRVTYQFNGFLQAAISLKRDIILDNTHASDYWLSKTLKELQEKAPNYQIYIKFFDISLWRAKWRVYWRYKKTGKHIPLKVLKDMHRSYKKINKKDYKDYIL